MCPTGVTLPPDPAAKGADFRPAFDALDADRDGKISKEDLRSFYAGFSGGVEEEVIGTMMSVADVNRDGYVEYEEFETVLRERSGGGGGGGGVMEEAFRVMDRDGDGRVGVEDLKGYLKWAGFGEASDEDVKAMIRLGGGDERQGVTYDRLLKILAV
ncbi:calcium-binding protein CP1 [Diospyros lotus]|uniref:calcium-binding protein CP1 n=1 Tax=Diospyros lotus TaxID=55363 RepID=UPI0022592467|nr:calcium-binding protein CP1 [Diospyros lotus]